MPRHRTRKVNGGGFFSKLFKREKPIEALGYDPRKKDIPLSELRRLNWGFQPNRPATKEEEKKWQETIRKSQPAKAFKNKGRTASNENKKPTLLLNNNITGQNSYTIRVSRNRGKEIIKEREFRQKIHNATRRISKLKEEQESLKYFIAELIKPTSMPKVMAPSGEKEYEDFRKLAMDYYSKLVKGDPAAARLRSAVANAPVPADSPVNGDPF
jgi:hypothetical protein